MPIDFRATTSSPAFGRAPMPSSQIGQYVNQQIANTTRTNEAKRNALQPIQDVTLPSQQGQVAVEQQKQNEAQKLLGATTRNISDVNARMLSYSNTARKRRAAGTTSAGGSAILPGGTAGGPDGQVVNGWTLYRSAPNMAGLKGNRLAAVREASSYLGNPYVFAGRSHQGIDCSGLVMEVYNKLGFNVARHSAAWQRDNIPGVKTYNLNELRPGDLVAWQDGSHIAIYAGNGEIIEAQNPSVGVVRDKIWSKNVVGIKLRFAGE